MKTETKSQQTSTGIDPQEYVRAIAKDLKSRDHEFDYELPKGGRYATFGRVSHGPDIANWRAGIDKLVLEMQPTFRTKRAAAAYCLQLIAEHLGIAQLTLPDCARLHELPMRPAHVLQILGATVYTRGTVRLPKKTSTWRTAPYCGRYQLFFDLELAAIVTLAYRGEVWWPKLKADEKLLMQKVEAEGYGELVWFEHAIKTIYRRVAADFFDGQRPFYEHEIVKVERL